MSTSKINWNQIGADGLSAVGLYFAFDQYLRDYTPTIYAELIGVGIVGGGSIGVLSDFLYQMFMETPEEKAKREADFKNMSEKLKKQQHDDWMKNMLVSSLSTAGIYYVLRMLLPSTNASALQRYAVVVASVVGSRMVMDNIKQLLFSGNKQ